ncbi:hypothetical protein BC628DRAFT_1068446 [Trametes gibbosa]|nr:hypothetical protein BC628DRAFT_1068446 [Trametes gibbosa]
MTDSLRTPWILNYLILVAEQYGGNLAAVPRTDRGHKSQVIKFLTFPPQGSTEPCVIWADVSDKQHFIHARISSDAIQTFLKDPRHAGASITSYKTALVSLKKFRPAFGRVARRERSGGMTDHARLYLDVDEIVVIGCHGQPTWGAPKDIAQDANIEEWMLGLQQHGGGGNVLKLRKERLLAQAAERADQLQADSLENLRQVTIDAMNVKVQVARKSVAHKARPSTEAAEQRSAATREAVRRASWKRVHTNMMKYFRPPDDIFKQLLLLSGTLSGISEESTARPAIVHPPRHQLRSRSRSRSSSASYENDEFDKTRSPRTPTPSFSARTPSQWSPSTQGSPRVNECSATEDEADDLFAEDDDDLVDDEELPAQSPCAPDMRVGDELRPPAEQEQEQEPPLSVPQPAQPRAPLSSMPSVPYATSPQRTPSPALGKSPKGPLRDIDALPPSSFPAPTYPLPPSPTSSPRPMPITPAPSAPALRRVPLPQYNPLRRDPDASGQGRVLVQNSDTTSPASQRHSQSQSQGEPSTISQSDESGGSQSQNQPPSQPQRPSQLRNEIGHPVSADDEQVATSAAVERQDEDMADSQEVRNQPQQPWSQQSLSYKGDSQSQEALPFRMLIATWSYRESRTPLLMKTQRQANVNPLRWMSTWTERLREPLLQQ